MTCGKYKVANYTEETYCDVCGRLLTVGDQVIPSDDERHVFCSSNCKNTAQPASPLPASRCGYQAFGFMPPCTLDPGHTGDHEDGIGGHYGRTDDLELVRVAQSKELRYQPRKLQANMFDELEQPSLL